MGFGRRLEASTGLEYSDMKVKYAQRPESMTKYRDIKYTVLIYIHTQVQHSDSTAERTRGINYTSPNLPAR